MTPINQPEQVPCVWCGRLTYMTGTKECDKCHELKVRILQDPARAMTILSALAAPKAFGRMAECIQFFASVIKSGEPWTDKCQKAFDNALGRVINEDRK